MKRAHWGSAPRGWRGGRGSRGPGTGTGVVPAGRCPPGSAGHLAAITGPCLSPGLGVTSPQGRRALPRLHRPAHAGRPGSGLRTQKGRRRQRRGEGRRVRARRGNGRVGENARTPQGDEAGPRPSREKARALGPRGRGSRARGGRKAARSLFPGEQAGVGMAPWVSAAHVTRRRRCHACGPRRASELAPSQGAETLENAAAVCVHGRTQDVACSVKQDMEMYVVSPETET